MNTSQLFDRVKSVLSNVFEIPVEKIVPEAQLYTDLDLDSLDAIDLAIKLKSETGIELTEEEIRGIRTVADILEVVGKKIQFNPSAAG